MRYRVVSDSNNEILLINSHNKIYLDPKYIIDENYVFISHAHTDHLLNKSNFKKFKLKNRIISSKETSFISNLRGYFFSDQIGFHDDYTLLNSGHILGSKGLLIKDEIFYTGDLSIRNRAFLKKPDIPKVETLIIESTFGKPQYVFPPLEKVTHYVNTLISEMYGRGIPVILLGYSLGKAQILTSLFGSWKPLITHDDVFKFNQSYQELGIKLEDSVNLSDAIKLDLLRKKPWTLIYPLTSGKNPVISNLKEKYGAVTIGFSGWAVDKNYKNRMNLDYTIPFSDHCDFNELIEVVKKSKAKKVYTFHGFGIEFANYLNSLGITAEPVLKNTAQKITRKEKKNNNKTLDIYI